MVALVAGLCWKTEPRSLGGTISGDNPFLVAVVDSGLGSSLHPWRLDPPCLHTRRRCGFIASRGNTRRLPWVGSQHVDPVLVHAQFPPQFPHAVDFRFDVIRIPPPPAFGHFGNSSDSVALVLLAPCQVVGAVPCFCSRDGLFLVFRGIRNRPSSIQGSQPSAFVGRQEVCHPVFQVDVLISCWQERLIIRQFSTSPCLSPLNPRLELGNLHHCPSLSRLVLHMERPILAQDVVGVQVDQDMFFFFMFVPARAWFESAKSPG